jgi:hypothetical protein
MEKGEGSAVVAYPETGHTESGGKLPHDGCCQVIIIIMAEPIFDID